MSVDAARQVFGPDAIALALSEPAVGVELSDAQIARARRMLAQGGPGALVSWAGQLPWPEFCALIRVLCGQCAQPEMDQ